MIDLTSFKNFMALYEATQVVNLQGEEDPDVLDQLERIFKESRIHLDRNKSPLAAAVDQSGKVYGGVYSSWTQGSEEHEGHKVYEYSFDVAVDPKERAFAMIGPRLIDYAMQSYEHEKEVNHPYTMIKLWVVNPRLAEYMKNKYHWDNEHTAGGDTFLEKY